MRGRPSAPRVRRSRRPEIQEARCVRQGVEVEVEQVDLRCADGTACVQTVSVLVGAPVANHPRLAYARALPGPLDRTVEVADIVDQSACQRLIGAEDAAVDHLRL